VPTAARYIRGALQCVKGKKGAPEAGIHMVLRRAAVKRFAAYATATLGLVGWFGFNAVMAFYTYLWRNRPDHPDTALGRIAPMYQQQRIFFVAPWEKRFSFYGLMLALVLVSLAVVTAGVFFRRQLGPKLALSRLNAFAFLVFFAWFAYAAWPLAR
jgi:hypothetical protein